MFKLSNEEKRQVDEKLATMAALLLRDKNRIAKAIAMFIRNELEDFHVEYLSDEQMRDFNPLIRNAVFTFLNDCGDEYTLIASPSNVKLCARYILNNTISYLQEQGISSKGIDDFRRIINEKIGFPMLDLSTGGIMLAGYEYIYVPKYWEDCVYCNNLNKDISKSRGAKSTAKSLHCNRL